MAYLAIYKKIVVDVVYLVDNPPLFGDKRRAGDNKIRLNKGQGGRTAPHSLLLTFTTSRKKKAPPISSSHEPLGEYFYHNPRKRT